MRRGTLPWLWRKGDGWGRDGQSLGKGDWQSPERTFSSHYHHHGDRLKAKKQDLCAWDGRWRLSHRMAYFKGNQAAPRHKINRLLSPCMPK